MLTLARARDEASTDKLATSPCHSLHGNIARTITNVSSANAQKTRVIEFGRFASERRAYRGQGNPKTFSFLGFTHVCDKTRIGDFVVLRRRLSGLRSSAFSWPANFQRLSPAQLGLHPGDPSIISEWSILLYASLQCRFLRGCLRPIDPSYPVPPPENRQLGQFHH